MNRTVRSTVFLIWVSTMAWAAQADRAAGDETTDGPTAGQAVVYQPSGAPADPKVPARWNFFRDHAQATKLLEQLAAAHPNLCRLESLGKSYGKRDMWVLTITNHERGGADEKPAFWIDGGIHANELQGVDVVLYTAWYLAEMYDRSEMITRLLDERTFYLLPMMSPDSRDAHMVRPNTTHSPRAGQRPVDDDRDGLVDEDGADDLDGDGHITQMRIRDPNGRHKPHPDYPDLLIRAKADEKGEYTLLGQEGFDNDDDGRVNEDGDGFYDPNRDWPWHWQPAYVQEGAYHYPFSILENRMMADFVKAHPNIAGAQSYHNSGGLLLRPPGLKSDKVEPPDLVVYDQFGKRGQQMLPGYRYVDSAFGLYEVYGGEFEWFYSMLGVFAFTNELNTPFNMFRQKSEGQGTFGRGEELHKFNKYLLFGDGIVKWHEVDHPQYGKIEVGGLKKNWVRQPPSFLLEEECHRNMAFTLFHADQMPQAKVESITTRPLAGGLTEVSAVVVNHKLTPTHSARDVKNKLNPPDRVEITGRNIAVLAALSSDSVVFERPTEHKLQPHEVRLDTIRSMRPVYIRWIVRGNGPYTVTVRSLKGGTNARTSGDNT